MRPFILILEYIVRNSIESGLPGVDVRFYKIQEMTRELAKFVVKFEQYNPITHLIADINTEKR